jgi:hypothetical protein
MSTKKKSMNTPEDTSKKYFHPDIKEPQVLVCEFSEELSPEIIAEYKMKMGCFDELMAAAERVTRSNVSSLSEEIKKLRWTIQDILFIKFTIKQDY